MVLNPWLRLSGYLTLALSCAALIFAEVPFLPDLQLCLPPLLALLLAAWWVEGRWSLPNWGANLLGLLIVTGGASWLVRQFTDDESLFSRIPLHLALLPYIGPLVMAALMVKLFRPRGTGDFWRLQGLGLTQIGLGCILDGGPVFGGLLAAYLVSALACLALRYRLLLHDERAPFSSWWLLWFTLRWTPAVALPALLLFLVTPRRDSAAWEPLNHFRGGQLRLSAQSGGEEINLNDTGRIELDDEIAVRVTVTDATGQIQTQLPAEQRWRGVVLDWYANGKWAAVHPLPSPLRRGQAELPDFGPGQLFLTFTVQPRQAGSLVLAEPIQLGPRAARLPVVTISGEGHPRLFTELLGSVQPLQIHSRREYRYRQVIPARDDPSRTAAEGVRISSYLAHLTLLPPDLKSALSSWTVELLRRLSRQRPHRLPKRVVAALAKPAASFVLAPDDTEAVARVLCDYLASSGEYRYTLDLTRQDAALDPVLDFLLNVKQGHCERYATALALLLRSVGIPARIVKGYRGYETQGDGLYVVRHRHAHAWVEMLAPHRDSRLPSYDWLTLDPTPAESSARGPHFSLTHLWEEIQRFCLESWRTRIVDYNADEQADLWESLEPERRLATMTKYAIAALASIAALGGWLLLRRLSRRRAAATRNAEDTAFYSRFVRMVERYASLRPAAAQTAREYGERTRLFLQKRAALSSFAELPRYLVDLFYRVRFGGQPLSDRERATLDAELDRFAEALAVAD